MLSRVSYFCCMLMMLYTCFFFYPKWHRNDGEAVIGWDVSGYYWYLPSIFIYHDLKQQKFGDALVEKYKPTPTFDQSFVVDNGNRVMVYSSGMAVMYLPLFTIAHLAAPLLGYPADGFSMPYQFALQVGGLLVSLIGIWYFRKLLLKYFEDTVVAIILPLLVIGTNYLNYTAIDGSQTHNWLFTIYVFLLLATIRFYKTYRLKDAIAIGIFIGTAILIRPSEMIAILIPLLWGMESISIASVKQRFAFLRMHRQKIAVTAICITAIGMVQVIYWWYVSGHPLVYSYQDKGFSWTHPHFADYILSYRSGWLTYTPLLIFSFIGIIPFLRRGQNKVVILSFFFINLYIVSAWDIWWYGGTGGRAMIQSYPIILFPFAYLIQELRRTRILKWIATPFFLVFAYVNLWFTYNAHSKGGLYDSESMTKEYFWHVVGRYKVQEDVYKLKDTDELFSGEPANVQVLYHNDFDTATLPAPHKALTGKSSLYLTRDSIYLYTGGKIDGNAEWLRIDALYSTVGKEWNVWNMPKIIVQFTNKGQLVKERSLRLHHILGEYETRTMYFDVCIPGEPYDRTEIFYSNPASDVPLLVDDVTITTFN